MFTIKLNSPYCAQRRPILEQYALCSCISTCRPVQGVSKLCAINDRGALGRQNESKGSNEHRSGNASVKRCRE
jgi:hypothetical protein